MTLVLMFHDRPERSHANRALADAAAALPGVTVSDMGSIYHSSSDLDVDAEVARLLSADRLVLLFPIQWYSTPPLLKVWQDRVLTRMYYVNPQIEGDRLNGLPVLIAATAGNVETAYSSEGQNGFSLRELLRPLEATARRCGWRWADPFLLYQANKLDNAELAASGRAFLEHLTRWCEVR